MAAADPDIGMLGHEEDLLLVDCPHGYRQLMQKMVMAYRLLLDRFEVKFFIRADVDSVLLAGAFICLFDSFKGHFSEIFHLTRTKANLIFPLVFHT